MEAFHTAHFGASSTSHFSATFLPPETTAVASAGEQVYDGDTYTGEEEEFYEEEDDGLGYYADGTKRTLTDEQIAMFRHSEIETILRQRRYAAERGTTQSTPQVHPTPSTDSRPTSASASESLLEAGELEDKQRNGNGNGNVKRKKSKKQKNKKREVKPDLRKRSWDVVDQGVGSLDYGEEVNNDATGRRPQAGRRTISYDDI